MENGRIKAKGVKKGGIVKRWVTKTGKEEEQENEEEDRKSVV